MTQQSQQQILEEQKVNCPMCKIVSGEIPAQKVYENQHVIAIMDINPATKGHILVLPKEHYPILPIVPPETFKELFKAVRDINKCVEDGMISQGTTTLIASGGAAGQQLPHMLIHIIPREAGDGLEKFDLKPSKFDEKKQKEQDEAKALLEKNLKISLGRRFGTIKVTKEEVLNLINKNPQLKQIILTQPDEFKKLVPQNEQLKAIFANVDIDEIIAIVKGTKRDTPLSENATEKTKEEKKNDNDENSPNDISVNSSENERRFENKSNKKKDEEFHNEDITAEDKIVDGEFEDIVEESENKKESRKEDVDDLLDALGGEK